MIRLKKKRAQQQNIQLTGPYSTGTVRLKWVRAIYLGLFSQPEKRRFLLPKNCATNRMQQYLAG
jgi:hypothetical protein